MRSSRQNSEVLMTRYPLTWMLLTLALGASCTEVATDAPGDIPPSARASPAFAEGSESETRPVSDPELDAHAGPDFETERSTDVHPPPSTREVGADSAEAHEATDDGGDAGGARGPDALPDDVDPGPDSAPTDSATPPDLETGDDTTSGDAKAGEDTTPEDAEAGEDTTPGVTANDSEGDSEGDTEGDAADTIGPLCDPQCNDKDCGDDGCGGSCGTCPEGQSCEGGQCSCAPQCEGKA